MSQADFARSLVRVLVYEGGKVDNSRDPGGRTNFGITQKTYSAWLASKGEDSVDVYKISTADRDSIYETEYWDRIRGDDLPTGLDLVVFDAAVNSGVGQAGKWLQQALGPNYTGIHDGVIGKQTLLAAAGVNDLDSLISSYCSRRLATLQRLRTWNTFGKGWHARIANVQKAGIAWADADTHAPDPVDLISVNGHQKAPVPDNLTTPRLSTVTTQVAAGAGAVVGVATDTAQQITPIADTFGWVKYVAAGLTLVSVVAGIAIKISNDAAVSAEKGATAAEVDPDADAGLPTVKTTPEVSEALKTSASTVAIATAAPAPPVLQRPTLSLPSRSRDYERPADHVRYAARRHADARARRPAEGAAPQQDADAALQPDRRDGGGELRRRRRGERPRHGDGDRQSLRGFPSDGADREPEPQEGAVLRPA